MTDVKRNSTFFVIVMGVSGCGKTTIGNLLADKLNIAFLDGDSLHPQVNLDKMKSGIPLTDTDRLGWLQAISYEMTTHKGQGLVIGCSALKRKYRQILSGFSHHFDENNSDKSLEGERTVHFLFLKGSYADLLSRVQDRQGHFMPASLLQSQLDTLQEPTTNEFIDQSGHVHGILQISSIQTQPQLIVSQFIEKISDYELD